MIARHKIESRWDKVTDLTCVFRYGYANYGAVAVGRDVKDPNKYCPGQASVFINVIVSHCFPDCPVANIIQLASFAPLMEQDDEPTEEQWTAAMSNIQAEVDAWREEIRVRLKSKMPESLLETAGTVDPLMRVDCVWRLTDETREDMKQQVGSMQSKLCSFDCRYEAITENIGVGTICRHLVYTHGPSLENRHASGFLVPNHFEDFIFDDKSSDAVRRWLAVTDIKPEDASSESLSALGPRFYLLQHADSAKPTSYITFASAVSFDFL